MTLWSRMLMRLRKEPVVPAAAAATTRVRNPRPTGPVCRACRHFRNDPAEIEAAVPGLASLSSAHASVRADDGLCLKHDRFVTARSSCAHFRAW